MDNTAKIAACTQWDDSNIKGFFGQYRFLSNFHVVPILYKGKIYGSTEAAYMSAKTYDLVDKEKLQNITKPSKAKQLGREVVLRSDWDDIKDEVMYDVNLFKYTYHQDLKALLLATGYKHIEESNWWGDKYWGTVDGEGRNQLGKTLMLVRTHIRLVEWRLNPGNFDTESAENAMNLL